MGYQDFMLAVNPISSATYQAVNSTRAVGGAVGASMNGGNDQPSGASGSQQGWNWRQPFGRQTPERIGSTVGAGNFDGTTRLGRGQANRLSKFDDRQLERYQTAVQDEVTNLVRTGMISEDEARNRMQQATFAMPDLADISNSGQLQQGAMGGSDLGNPQDGLGDINGLGLDNEYFAQLDRAARQQGNLTQDLGDQSVSREFDRTLKYRLPLEDYRMSRDFGYGQKAEQNTTRRQMAAGLLNSYTSTAQQLMTSGL